MLFAKLLLSPMPHARVVRIDTSAAAAMPGVKAILTVDDLPAVVEGANLGEGIIASTLSERGLTNEPLYQGEPILALAAGWVASDVLRWLRSETPVTWGASWLLGGDPVPHERSWRRHPYCGCAWWESA